MIEIGPGIQIGPGISMGDVQVYVPTFITEDDADYLISESGYNFIEEQ